MKLFRRTRLLCVRQASLGSEPFFCGCGLRPLNRREQRWAKRIKAKRIARNLREIHCVAGLMPKMTDAELESRLIYKGHGLYSYLVAFLHVVVAYAKLKVLPEPHYNVRLYSYGGEEHAQDCTTADVAVAVIVQHVRRLYSREVR